MADRTHEIDDTLSDDAKACAGRWFGMGRLGKTTLTFQMVEYRPTARAQAALDELERAGIVEKRPYNRRGGVVYTLLKDCRPYFQWMQKNRDNPDLNFRLVEPIEGRRAND